MTGRKNYLAIPVRILSSVTLSLKKPMTTNSFTRAEIEQIVIMERLHLYNWGIPCGAQAICNKLQQEEIRPLPSLSNIKGFLSRHVLTHVRSGLYP